MTTLHFTARLLSDAVISERSATTGGHRTLDYLPGAVFLGAAAHKLYSVDPQVAFTLFHSGKVRFGNAYPLTADNLPTLPIPLSWHLPKGKEGAELTAVRNLIHTSDAQFEQWDNRGEQQKQLRSGYFALSGEKVSPSVNYRLKTALDRTRQGAARESQLFGYQSLAAGSAWYFSVAADDEVDQKLLSYLAEALSGVIRVGRSRSAEYGLLAVQKTDTAPFSLQPSAGERLILYCCSDLALADPLTGAPTYVPDPAAHFGLEGATFAAGRSYLRTRSYAPFNSTRKQFDLERQVIAKGSVLVFDRPGGFGADDLAGLHKRLVCGCGNYRQDGLGQLWVNPPFLADEAFTPGAARALTPPAAAEDKPLPELAHWLNSRAAERADEAAAIKQVDGWIRDLVKESCPSNSQWGQLRIIALQAKDLNDLSKKLARLTSEGVSQKQWDKPVTVQGKKTTYRQFIVDIARSGRFEQVQKRLYLLGNRLPRLKNLKETGGDR